MALSDGVPLRAEAPAHTVTTLPGADQAGFDDALAQWLADDEEPALKALASMAQEGNIAARVLLAIIDKTPALQGPWLAYLPRDERLALLRAPGGLSGQNWLHHATDIALARTWLALMSVDAGLDVIAEFERLGEARAAREALVMLSAREHPALHELTPEAADPDQLYLLWRSADDARRRDLLAQVPAGHPQRALMGEPRDDNAMLGWLRTATVAAPLRAICATLCPQTEESCLGAAYAALASHNALITLGTPVETLIAQDEFLDSARGRATVLRRILQSTDARGRRTMLTQVRAQDECLAEALHAENARYRYRRPGTEDTEAQPTE
ncbi:MAG: hypothetical protein ACK4LQ_10745 [Pararhodobacter sp.]